MDSPWHTATMRHHIEQRQIEPLISPPLPDRVIARLAVQQFLDGTAALAPDLTAIAELWREGAEADRADFGELSWSIFECRGTSCRTAVQEFLNGWAAQIEAATGAAFAVPRYEPGQQA